MMNFVDKRNHDRCETCTLWRGKNYRIISHCIQLVFK